MKWHHRDLERRASGAAFDAFYYRHCCGKPYVRNDEWLAFFGAIADRIVSDIRPQRVLDAGCALGLLVEKLRDRGVDAVGIDISSFAIDHVHEPIRPFCRVASAADTLGQGYDLIVAIELAEHMPAAEAEAAIANFCAHTRDVLFSSSPVDYEEPTHVNVRPTDYWAELFARYGFYRDVDFDGSFITPWAARFCKRDDPVHRIVRDYERRYSELSLERNGARSYSMKVQTRLAQSEARCAELAAELAHARQTIVNMERSRFWQLRNAWVRLKTLWS